MSFLSNLAKGQANAMQCSICGPYPAWLGFDGVSLNMSKARVQDIMEPIHSGATTIVKNDAQLVFTRIS